MNNKDYKIFNNDNDKGKKSSINFLNNNLINYYNIVFKGKLNPYLIIPPILIKNKLLKLRVLINFNKIY